MRITLDGARAFSLLLALWVCSVPPALDAQPPSFKLAYYNIQSGKGEPALPGHPSTFVDTTNCTDPTRPLNAWGVGLVQRALVDAIGNDPAVVALGLGEAWTCASPARVLAVLGWRTASSSRNGVAMVSRYGFAGPEVWQRLDTSMNENPADTMWVLRRPACLDAACSRSFPLMVSHWYATAGLPSGAASIDRQAAQTVRFMAALGSEPHALIGDLNVWESPDGGTVCRQVPLSGGLNRLHAAGYVDAWALLHPGTDGFTGMTNRPGCGVPEGSAWKRIDYALAPSSLAPLSMTRFGVVPAGDEAPSDHYGIVAEYPIPGDPVTPSSAPPNAPAGPGDIVIHVAQANMFAGDYHLVRDDAAASGLVLDDPEQGVPKRTSPLAAPVDYVEATFSAERGRPYRLWVRGKAVRNHWSNDSLYLQFSHGATAAGTPAWRIGSTSAVMVSIERCSGCGLSEWGWGDNGYDAPGQFLYFTRTGTQTVRIQTREDGVRIDQIVLSPSLYLNDPPGLFKNDSTILPASMR
jgi:exonuclease III